MCFLLIENLFCDALCCMYCQDFLQVLSMFAGFNFQWPPAVTGLYHAFSLVNFNFELLAPECSVSLNYEAKWYIVESLPVILLISVCVVIGATRALQWGERYFLGRLPFGALSTLNLIDVCIGIFISGLFMLYFGKPVQTLCFSHVLAAVPCCTVSSSTAPGLHSRCCVQCLVWRPCSGDKVHAGAL